MKSGFLFFVCLLGFSLSASNASTTVEGVVECNCPIFYQTVYGFSGHSSFTPYYSLGTGWDAYDSAFFGSGGFTAKEVVLNRITFRLIVNTISRRFTRQAEELSARVLAKTAKERLHPHNRRGNRLSKRGWSDRDIEDLLKDPVAINLTKDKKSIVYWLNRRDHIVVTRESSLVLQVSNRLDVWRLDSNIIYPFAGRYPQYSPTIPPNYFIYYYAEPLEQFDIGSLF